MCELKAQGLANTAWAFATTLESDEKLFAVWVGAVERRVSEFDVQSLSSTSWAFATVGQSDGDLFATMARSAERHAEASKEQGRPHR